VFGVAICAAVFAARGGYASPAAFVAGFGPAMGACAGLALVGATVGLLVPGRRSVPLSSMTTSRKSGRSAGQRDSPVMIWLRVPDAH
jgi:hypothetical protein